MTAERNSSLGKLTTARPHLTIACQDLLTTPDVGHSGFLRKQLTCKKKGMSFLNTLSKTFKIPWVQRFVVLSAGSLYHYENEMSKRPTGCYSLKHYNQVVRAGDIAHSAHPWAFKVCHDTHPFNDKYFAASSENDWKKWQQEIRTQMVLANGLKGKSQVPDDLDDAIYSPSDDFGSDSSRPCSIEEEEESDDDDYIEIEDGNIGFGRSPPATLNRPLPAPPNTKNQQASVGRKASFQDADDDNQPKILALMLKKNSSLEDDGDDLEEERPTKQAPPRAHRAPAPLPNTPTDKKVKPLPSLPSPAGVKSPPSRALPPMPSPTNGSKSRISHNTSHNLSNNNYGDDNTGDQTTATSVMDKAKKFGVPMMGPSGNKPLPLAKPVKPVKKGPLDTSMKTVPQPPSSSRKKELPAIPVTSQREDRLTLKDYFWDGHDKDACQQILKNIGRDGVFMVRDSDSGHGQTLMCYCKDDNMVRKYKITTLSDNTYTIKVNSEWNFPTMEDLLKHYMHNNLPNRPTQLTIPFNKLM